METLTEITRKMISGKLGVVVFLSGIPNGLKGQRWYYVTKANDRIYSKGHDTKDEAWAALVEEYAEEIAATNHERKTP